MRGEQVALDGRDSNSPFTTAPLDHMAAPGASINDVMIAVRRDVLKATGGRQEPWDQSSLRERFCFHEPTVEIVSKPLLSEEALFEKAALEHWDAIKGASDRARLREFLADYGTSRMGKLAREALQRLATSAWGQTKKRDEAALARFIEDFAGTREIAEVSALLAKLQVEREAAALKMAQKRDKPPNGPRVPWAGIIALGAGVVAVAVLLMILQPRPTPTVCNVQRDVECLRKQ